MKNLSGNRGKTLKRFSAELLSLLLVIILLPGCSPATPERAADPPPTTALSPTSAPTLAPTATPAPEPSEAPEAERLIYVPSYEPLPLTMDPLTTRFPVETAEGVLFLRVVQTQETSGYCLMKGGKDAQDPVTVISFDPELYVERVFPAEDGHAWLNQMNFQTGEAGLLEVALDSGEILREIPFPAENGSVTGLFDLPDGSLGVVTKLQTGAQALFSMTDDGSFTPVEAPLNESSNYLLNTTFVGTEGSGLPEGECLAYDKDSLFAFTPGSKERRDLLRWSDWGISSFYTMPLGMKDGTLRLLDNQYREYVTLTPTPQDQVPVRQEITMACLTVQSAVETAVRDFNRRSTEYFITIRDYSGGLPFTQDVMDQAITAMNLDIASGKMPDLLSMQDGVPFKSYAKKGLLLDLTPWLEEGIELLPQLQRAGTVDGKLLMICGSFAILTAAGNRDYLGDSSGWTVAEAIGMSDSLADGAEVFTSRTTRDTYMAWLSYYLEGFVDWENGTAGFDSEEFRDALALAASLPTEMPMENTADREIMQGQALVNLTTIASIQHWQYQDLIYMGKLACPGFPTGDRVGSLIYMQVPMAVSAASTCKEGAWAFLRSMLDESVQTAYTDLFPSTRAAFENQMAEAMREPTPEEGYKTIYVFSNGGQYRDPTVYAWEGEDGEIQPRTVYYWMDDNYSVIREEIMYAMSEDQRDKLMSLLDSAVRSSSYDQVIAGIVKEEAGALFAGQRDIKEVSQRIQARIELYMAEQN